jgi:acyl-coenzyme A thioesterase PaaI-like protein
MLGRPARIRRMRLNFATLRRFWNLWPPYLFTGIRVLSVSPDGLHAKVRLRLHWWNRNAFGTHFGGSLLAMVNPFWPLLVLHRLGRDYIVWDTKNEIEFVRALREDVFAEFRLDPGVVEDMRAAAAGGDRVLRWFPFEVASAAGEVAARGRIEVYVRRKRDR